MYRRLPRLGRRFRRKNSKQEQSYSIEVHFDEEDKKYNFWGSMGPRMNKLFVHFYIFSYFFYTSAEFSLVLPLPLATPMLLIFRVSVKFRNVLQRAFIYLFHYQLFNYPANTSLFWESHF